MLNICASCGHRKLPEAHPGEEKIKRLRFDETVPAAKRLVIEFVSVGPGLDLSQFTITTFQGPCNVMLVQQGQNTVGASGTLWGASQTVRLYADPGTSVDCRVFRNTGTPVIDIGLTVSGYLVDVP
jgi:hypothetical protein